MTTDARYRCYHCRDERHAECKGFCQCLDRQHFPWMSQAEYDHLHPTQAKG